MASIRPNAEPAATTVAGGDIFLIDGASGVRALAASVVPLRDANGNAALNNLQLGYTTTATAAATTTLLATSTWAQYFTGATTQTVVLPVTSTLALGHSFYIQNSSSGALTVNSSGGNLVATIAPGASALVTCILITGTTAASWLAKYHAALVATGKVLTVSNTLTFAGTDGTTQTFPATSATIARTDAGQTFTGTQTFGALTATTLNGNTFTAGTGVLTIAAAKTLTASNTLTLAGTDGTTMTFPGTSDTVVTLGATQTLTNKTLTAPAIGAATGTSLVLTGGGISFATSGQGHIGTTTNDNANAGVVGEYAETVVLVGSAVSITTNTAKDIATLALTAGDWDIDGVMYFLPAATTSLSIMVASISATLNTLDTTSGKFAEDVRTAYVPGTGQISLAIPPYRLSLSGSVTQHFVAQATFTVSTMTAYCIIRARRVR